MLAFCINEVGAESFRGAEIMQESGCHLSVLQRFLVTEAVSIMSGQNRQDKTLQSMMTCNID